jgi:hypothetical protein
MRPTTDFPPMDAADVMSRAMEMKLLAAETRTRSREL